MIKTQQGIGMVEVLIALLLLATAMLGFAALQTSSIKATGESIDRVKALSIMEGMAEKIRLNPAAINTYKTEFNSINTRAKLNAATPPTKQCGLNGSATATACTTAELATAEVYLFATQIKNTGLIIDVIDCPRNSTGTSLLNSNCIVAAWGSTTPSKGSAANNCLKDNGQYHPQASCVFMEIN